MAFQRYPSDSTAVSSDFDNHMDIDSAPSSRQSSLTNASIHGEVDEIYQARLAQLQGTLSSLRLDAQRQLNLQPKSTQLALTGETRKIFKSYSEHGSEARLSNAIHEFLKPSDDTKGLKMWSPKEAADAEKKANERMSNLRLHVALRALAPFRQAAMASGRHPDSVDPTTIPDGDITDSPLDGRKTHLNDEESLSILKELDFAPADIKLIFPEETAIPPEILITTNKILALLNLQANMHLDHHVAKYITLSPTPHRVENGYAVLRLGLQEQYAHMVSNLFATATNNNDGLSLTQSQRSWLRECYDHMGIGLQGGREGEMTERERLYMARAAGIQEGEVEEWFDFMTMSTRGRKAMRTWMLAREIEAIRKAKLEARY